MAQLAEWLGWMGSGGGAESVSTPLGLVILLTPSLFLGSSLLVLMVSVHELSPPDRKIWSLAAVRFATAFTALISIQPFELFLYAIDIRGYSFMSVATLLVAGVSTARDCLASHRCF